MISLAEAAFNLISVFEGEQLRAYQDRGGIWTNGIGNTRNVVPSSVITHEQALIDFQRNIAELLKYFPSTVSPSTLMKQVAILSFGFNCGSVKMLKVMEGEDKISNPIHSTDRHGDVLRGLVARRRMEQMLVDLGIGGDLWT